MLRLCATQLRTIIMQSWKSLQSWLASFSLGHFAEDSSLIWKIAIWNLFLTFRHLHSDRIFRRRGSVHVFSFFLFLFLFASMIKELCKTLHLLKSVRVTYIVLSKYLDIGIHYFHLALKNVYFGSGDSICQKEMASIAF